MEKSQGNCEKDPRSPTIEGTAVARMVASRATSAVDSISAMSTGPRSDRRPTAAGFSGFWMAVILRANPPRASLLPEGRVHLLVVAAQQPREHGDLVGRPLVQLLAEQAAPAVARVLDPLAPVVGDDQALGPPIVRIRLPDDQPDPLQQGDLAADRALVDAEVRAEVAGTDAADLVHPGQQGVGRRLQVGVHLGRDVPV